MQVHTPSERQSPPFPAAYIKPCLALIHGATSRLDELCNTIIAYLRSECVIGEEVYLGTKDDRVVATVVAEAQIPEGMQLIELFVCLWNHFGAKRHALSMYPRSLVQLVSTTIAFCFEELSINSLIISVTVIINKNCYRFV